MRAAFVLTTAIGLALTGCSRSEGAPRGAPASTPKEAPLATISAPELVGKIREAHARATLVNVWATWCGSCEREVPMLQKLADKLAPKQVDVMLVSVDEPDEQPMAKTFLAENAVHLPSYVASRPLGDFKEGLDRRWQGVLPASFLFDAQGNVRYYWGGEAFENEIMPIVDGLLDGRPIDGEATFGLMPDQPVGH